MENLKESKEKNDITNKTIDLISSVFKDKSKKIEIIEKLRPFFTLKVIPQREIEKVYSSVEKIPAEKVDLIEEFKYEEEKYDSKNIFETKSKSLGLSNFDLDLSINIFGYKQSGGYEDKDEKSKLDSVNKSKIHCMHSIVISLFRILIDFKDIKFTKQIYEELNGIEQANTTERKKLLEKLVDKFGLYVPLELLIGGRINMSFEANNEEEKKEYHSILKKKIWAEFGGGIWNVSASAKIDKNNNKTKEAFSESIGKIENLSIKLEGGDYMYKADLKNWIKSFNIDNLQIIEYKTLIPLYCFIPNLESKLTICLQKYEDIVLQEIYNLIDKDFKIQEQNLFEGSPINKNTWKVGITKDNYKSFVIYKKIFHTKLIISKTNNNETKKEDIISGEVPDGFTIVGWKLKTNSFSKPYDINTSWEKSKEFFVIGSDCFKFRVLLSEKNKESKDFMEVDWNLEIFCIHSDFLIPCGRVSNYRKVHKEINHYFSNCDCFQITNSRFNRRICFYNNENIESKNCSKISLESCNNCQKLFRDLKEVEDACQKGFMNSIRIIDNIDGNFFDLNGYVKAPDNSPYKNGIFQFNIKINNDNNNIKYKAYIKTKICHINIYSNGDICNTYFLGYRDQEQNLLGSLYAIFQTFCLNSVEDPCDSSLANLYKQNQSSFLKKCKEFTEKYSLNMFPDIEYLFEYPEESENSKLDDKIEVLCSIGKYIVINKEELNIKIIFEKLGIKNPDKWSFIVGNNLYLKPDQINNGIIQEIQKIGKLIIVEWTRC